MELTFHHEGDDPHRLAIAGADAPERPGVRRRIARSGGGVGSAAAIHAAHLPSLGQCYRPSGFEKYLRIARPEIDQLALGEPGLPITLAREFDLDASGCRPGASSMRTTSPSGRTSRTTASMPPPLGWDIDLVETHVDLGRDIVDAVEVPQIDLRCPRSRPGPRGPARGTGSYRPGNNRRRGSRARRRPSRGSRIAGRGLRSG